MDLESRTFALAHVGSKLFTKRLHVRHVRVALADHELKAFQHKQIFTFRTTCNNSGRIRT